MQRRAQHKTQTLLQSSRQAILPQTGAKKRKKEKKEKKEKAETGFIPVSAFLFLYSSKQTVLPSS